MYRRILVPVDGSETARCGLQHALGLAKDQHAELKLIHIVEEFSPLPGYWLYPSVVADAQVLEEAEEQGRQLLSACIAEAAGAGIDAQFELFRCRENRVADIIVKAAADWQADVVVMGTHGRRGFNRLILGSDADLVIRSAPCPVLMVRGEARQAEGP